MLGTTAEVLVLPPPDVPLVSFGEHVIPSQRLAAIDDSVSWDGDDIKITAPTEVYRPVDLRREAIAAIEGALGKLRQVEAGESTLAPAQPGDEFARPAAAGGAQSHQMSERSRKGQLVKMRKETLKDGRVVWRARGVSVGKDPVTGKRAQRTITRKTKHELEAELHRIGHAVDKGTYIKPWDGLVPELIDSYLHNGADQWEANTRLSYANALQPAREWFAHRRARSVVARGRRGLQAPPADQRPAPRREAGHGPVAALGQPGARPAPGRVRPRRAGREGCPQPGPVRQARQARRAGPCHVE